MKTKLGSVVVSQADPHSWILQKDPIRPSDSWDPSAISSLTDNHTNLVWLYYLLLLLGCFQHHSNWLGVVKEGRFLLWCQAGTWRLHEPRKQTCQRSGLWESYLPLIWCNNGDVWEGARRDHGTDEEQTQRTHCCDDCKPQWGYCPIYSPKVSTLVYCWSPVFQLEDNTI